MRSHRHQKPQRTLKMGSSKCQQKRQQRCTQGARSCRDSVGLIHCLTYIAAQCICRGMIEKELVAASTEPLILSLLAKGESYGYDLIQEVKELSRDKSSGRMACFTRCCTGWRKAVGSSLAGWRWKTDAGANTIQSKRTVTKPSRISANNGR